MLYRVVWVGRHSDRKEFQAGRLGAPSRYTGAFCIQEVVKGKSTVRSAIDSIITYLAHVWLCKAVH
jgi:hypothetical protein